MPLTRTELLALAAAGETHSRRFMPKVPSAASLAAELAAFANCEGGDVFVGVSEDGTLPGLTFAEERRVGRLVGDAASRLVCGPLLVETETVRLDGGLSVVVLRVPRGQEKPHFDGNGVIWVKCGPERRPVASREELVRLFLADCAGRPEEAPTRAGLARLDEPRLAAFLRDVHRIEWPSSEKERVRILSGMKLADASGMLTLAGALFFAEHPEWVLPHCVVGCVAGSGLEEPTIFGGPLAEVFRKTLEFVVRAAKETGVGPDRPEIPALVFGELIVNALIHRDYRIDDIVRVFVRDDGVEIVSPGHLPGEQRVENARHGVSLCRNPLLTSYAAKGLLPCRELGSGIMRSLEAWPAIDFVDDREGRRFTAVIRRSPKR